MELVIETFRKEDVSGRGAISFAAFANTLGQLNDTVNAEKCKQMVQSAGAEDGDGNVRYEKFLSWINGDPAADKKAVFFDMKHSNNAARIRLWLAHKEGVGDVVERKVLEYPDLKEEWFAKINPLKKVPGLLRPDGVTVFESYVILDYLEDKYRSYNPSFKPITPEGRQAMEIMIRCHDLYIASPNCTEEGFSHSQGSMYLSYGWHGPARGMDLKTRAAKFSEIWKQLTWLNSVIVGPCLVGSELTLADFTWFPTTIFMEFMLPKYGWPDIFRDKEGPFPKIAAWWLHVNAMPKFAEVRQEIWEYWEEMDGKGQFKHIIDEIAADTTGLKFKYP